MVGSAEAKSCDTSENELHPSDYWHSLANEAMSLDHNLPYLAMYALFKVEFQVDTHSDLSNEHEHNVGHKLGVDVLGELPAFVLVAEEISHNGEERAECLDWNVPFGADYLMLSVS
jgi:hypothetical protein